MHLPEIAERVRHSLWFVPAVAVVVAALAAIGMVALSSAFPRASQNLPLIFGAGPDGARAMLQAIGGSVITVAGTVFSITIVALQLTSSQFSPRVLRTFLRDPVNQTVLGVFIGTFTYSLLVLRSIRGEGETGDAAFVPGPAITVGLLLAFVSVGMLIFFIHHISVRIQVTTILAGIADDTLKSVSKLTGWNDREEGGHWRPATAPVEVSPPPPSGATPPSSMPPGAVPIAASNSGYLQHVDLDALVDAARVANGRYGFHVAPGAWVQEAAPVAAFVPAVAAPVRQANDDHRRRVSDALALGAERSLQQDSAFGIQQIVDIAVKSLSPSLNDPTTAMNCIDRLTQVLCAAGLAADPPRAFADADGIVRLEIPFPGFDELVQLAFDQIRFYGGETPAVAIHVARALTQLVQTLPPERHGSLRRQAGLLGEAAASVTPESARLEVARAVEPLLG